MKRNGFTFIEVVISITIFTIIIVAVYSVFYMGLRTWRKGQEEKSLQKVRLAFLKIEKELKKTFFFSKVPFKGTREGMIFPLSLPEEDIEKIYVVTYSIDKDKDTDFKQLIRKEKIFTEDFHSVEEKEKSLLPLMKDIKFEYAYLVQNPIKTLEWQNMWDGEEKDNIPSGVRISLEREDSAEVYSKLILLQHEDFSVE